jgi:amino acid permease
MIQNRSIIGPVGILAGGIIGAGVFSLPYVVNESGLLLGLGLLLVATITYCIIHLMYADIIVGTPGQHRFVGYIARYLGRRWSYVGVLMAVVEMVCVLTIYLILSISFLKLLWPGVPDMTALLLFWAVGSATMFWKLKRLAFAETLVLVGIVAIMVTLFGAGLGHIEDLGRISLFESKNILLPLSAIFFALSGRVAIPPLVNLFRSAGQVPRHRVRLAIITGTVIPAVAYAIFIIAVLVLSGTVSQDAVTGIAGLVPGWLMTGVGALGLLTLWSSYILVGLDVSDTLRYDLEVPRWLRLFVVVGAPVMLYLAGFTSFIGLVSFVGGVFLAFEGVFIVLMWRQAHHRKNLGGLIRVSRTILLFLWLVFTAALIGVVSMESF